MSADSLRLLIDAPDRVPMGEPVPFTLRLENASERTLDLYLRGRAIAFDVVVSRPDGGVVWRRLAGEVVPAILRIETLEPGAVLELDATWDQRSGRGETVLPGTYLIHGELLTEGDPLVTPVTPLRIGPEADGGRGPYGAGIRETSEE